MYIWHPIVFILLMHTDVARAIRGGNGMLAMASSVGVAIVAMLAITLLRWHCIQKRFLESKGGFSDRVGQVHLHEGILARTGE